MLYKRHLNSRGIVNAASMSTYHFICQSNGREMLEGRVKARVPGTTVDYIYKTALKHSPLTDWKKARILNIGNQIVYTVEGFHRTCLVVGSKVRWSVGNGNYR